MRGILRCSEVSHAVVELREKPRNLDSEVGGPKRPQLRFRSPCA